MTIQKSILIIEDESIIALGLKERLIGLGFTSIYIANTGKKAIKLADKISPDLILAEIIIHGEIDGVEAVQQIQKKLKTPVIYITSNKYLEKEPRVKKTKPVAVLGKPFEDQDLLQAIQKALT